MGKHQIYHALKVDKDICYGCTHCMNVCPTEAIRINDGKALILKKRCVDCGECLKVCPVNARFGEDF
jgi:Fe-S-cluster-containing hydrogenase component 2